MQREIEWSETQAEIESLRRQLEPRGRHEKYACANAEVMLMRMITGAALVVSLITSRQLVLLVMAGVGIVVFVALSVAMRTRKNKRFPCH